ncbi:hypothetical protein [Chamaesiphon minutus]|jgi:hypothetical protein|uniref:Uncharacterized protein n=1 Tax=Chamaesiphon minutus (strain ATCC 27169 / PCC 6605) TaxID=1173020 RepID=K9UFE5_CHAP6|nr:hypothetical protein [Chamaesiphon minutus]AFY92929.1 hypothetical protein Cha6605_1808 [Chamaesiphon minutus PCC 6605]
MTILNSKRKAPIIVEPAGDDLEIIDIDAVTGINSDYEESDRMRRAKDAMTVGGWRMATLGFMGINGMLLIVILAMQFAAATKPMTPFVTRGNGEIESLEYMAGNDRNPALIADFARTQMIGIFTWRNTLPVEGNPPDPGIAVGQGRISTTSYRYTFGLSTEFAEVFRTKLATVMAKLTTNGAQETVYIPANISKPVLVSPGTWTVDVVGSLFYSKDLKVGSSIPINRRLTIRAVPPLTLSEASLLYKDKGLAVAVARIRSQGLETTSMAPIARNFTVPNGSVPNPKTSIINEKKPTSPNPAATTPSSFTTPSKNSPPTTPK